MPESISEDDKLAVEQFVVVLYDRSSTAKQVNEARLDMFARKQKAYEMIPPISVSSSGTHQKSSIPSRACMGSNFDPRANYSSSCGVGLDER